MFYLQLLGTIAVLALLAIALSAVTVAVAVEKHRIERQRKMQSHWQYPERFYTGIDMATPEGDHTVVIQGSLEGNPNWRNQLPAKGAG